MASECLQKKYNMKVYVHDQCFSEDTSNFLLKRKFAPKGILQQYSQWVSPVKCLNDMLSNILITEFANLTKVSKEM